MSAFFAVYLFGAFLVIALILVKLIMFPAVDWLAHGPTIRRNLQKISAPVEKRSKWKLLFLPLEVALSWVNVVIISWQILFWFVNLLRELCTSVPPTLKELRYPLRNNPDLQPEMVWALVVAAEREVGGFWSEEDLKEQIEEIKSYHPSFNAEIAQKCLNSLLRSAKI